VVTELVNSTLGLVVFPWERLFHDRVKSEDLQTLVADGWPVWEITWGRCETLGQLIRLLRNGIAHGNVRFSSDSRVAEDVIIEVSNHQRRGKDDTLWVGQMSADRLKGFCLRVIDFVDQTIG
jgi:hypothetical protein